MSAMERILYRLARALYGTEVAHSAEMKEALTNGPKFSEYRAGEVQRVLTALSDFGIPLQGKTVVDFGCNEGSLSVAYLRHGATRVVGMDVDDEALGRARRKHPERQLAFVRNPVDAVPLTSESVELVVSYDVFEHVAHPAVVARELHRVLKRHGKIVIGTWGWRHPFAAHLWAVMPVPWAHLLVSEEALLRVCRRVYLSNWYRPTMFDYDGSGERLGDKFTESAISRDYLNHYLIRDFEQVFADSGFACETRLNPFGSKYAAWTAPMLKVKFLREFLAGYVWFVLTKQQH